MKELNLREVQKGAYKILQQIDKICNENNLTYYLAYGTLIGAVRNGGIIPWDDDIDIMMPRKDYDKFTEYCHQNKEKIKPLELFDISNDKYPYMINRLSDSNYFLEVQNEASYGIGLFVDIYPLDGISNKKKIFNFRGFRANLYSSMCFQATRQYYEIGHTEGILKKIIKRPFYLISKIVGKKRCILKLSKIYKKYDYDNSKYVGCIVWDFVNRESVFPKEYFGKPIYVRFEDGIFPVPKEYDKILRKIYGDYMKLPDENKRIPHHDYKAYKKK